MTNPNENVKITLKISDLKLCSEQLNIFLARYPSGVADFSSENFGEFVDFVSELGADRFYE